MKEFTATNATDATVYVSDCAGFLCARGRFFLVIFVLFVLFVLFAVYNPAYACSCLDMSEERSREVVDNAELIFSGRVVGLEQQELPEENFDEEAALGAALPVAQNPLFAHVRLKILDLYAGTADTGRIDAYVDTLTSCGYQMQIGDVMDFVLTRRGAVLVQNGLCDLPLPAHWKSLREGKEKE